MPQKKTNTFRSKKNGFLEEWRCRVGSCMSGMHCCNAGRRRVDCKEKVAPWKLRCLRDFAECGRCELLKGEVQSGGRKDRKEKWVQIMRIHVGTIHRQKQGQLKAEGRS